MGAPKRKAVHHLVPFCYLVLDAEAEVVEGLLELGLEALYVLGAALERRAVGLVGEVSLEELVHQLQVALVGDLLDVTPEDGLVLFSGHVSLLLPNPLA